MRRIDAIAITLGVFLAGGAVYLILRLFQVNAEQAGIWSQAIMMLVLLAWLGTYLVRVGTQNMTYNQQLKDYEEAVLNKKLEEMSPEEIEQLQAEIENDKGDG